MREIYLKPACREDARVLAYLLVQLYDSELPGIICGSLHQRVDFIYYGLLNDGFGGTPSHYLVFDNENTVIGTAALHLPGGDELRLKPRNILMITLMTLGVSNMVRMMLNLSQATTFLLSSKIPSNAAYIHGFVVDERYRRKGIGSVVVSELEQIALKNNMERICLHILNTNKIAKDFYLNCGYHCVSSRPRWGKSSTFSSDMFCKLLGRSEDNADDIGNR